MRQLLLPSIAEVFEKGGDLTPSGVPKPPHLATFTSHTAHRISTIF